MKHLFGAVIALTAFFAPSLAAANTVELSLRDGSFSVSGTLLGYDDVNYIIDSEFGPLMVSTDTTVCNGAACPENPANTLMITGDADFIQTVLPKQSDYILKKLGIRMQGQVKSPALAVTDLLVGKTDLVVSQRFLTQSELDVANEFPGTHLKQIVISQKSLNLYASVGDVPGVMDPKQIAAALTDDTNRHQISGDLEDLIALRQFLYLGGPTAAVPNETDVKLNIQDLGDFKIFFTAMCHGVDAGKTSPEIQRPLVFIYNELEAKEAVVRLARLFLSNSLQNSLEKSDHIKLVDLDTSELNASLAYQSMLMNSDTTEALKRSKSAATALAGMMRLPIELHVAENGLELDPMSQSKLSILAGLTKRGRFNGRSMIFVGFSDTSGDAQVNKTISSQRAQFVLDEMRTHLGNKASSRLRLTSRGLGQAMPRYCNDTNWGRRNNRRIEVWVSP